MQYKYIPKKIVCEKYLNDGQGFLPVDYKVVIPDNDATGFIVEEYVSIVALEKFLSIIIYSLNNSKKLIMIITFFCA